MVPRWMNRRLEMSFFSKTASPFLLLYQETGRVHDCYSGREAQEIGG